ncbi:hypothetical protein WR25_08389 [Diploscapter pachys]|uniref:Uncharacterized protein n=1 Tax=Diploscapter pachys TaxID=2018661 RepID=A0A2A2JNY7_9BILA|nr:hypothetical protein WR25_08389 [Diploscapter pachys]
MCNTGNLETCYTNRQLLSKEIVEEKRNLNREKLEFDREKLEAEKEQIEMQLKRLDIYQAVCNARDSEKYYIDNVLPSIEDARQCMDTVYTLIDFARELVEECETQSSPNDYKKVSDGICNFTIFACDQALRELDSGRSSISSRAAESLKSLPRGLTTKERDEFVEMFYNLEDAENELRNLCEQMKSNVKHRSSFDELKELIKNIKKAAETFRDRIYSVPIEGSAANAIEGIKELEGEIKKLTANLCNSMKSNEIQ